MNHSKYLGLAGVALVTVWACGDQGEQNAIEPVVTDTTPSSTAPGPITTDSTTTPNPTVVQSSSPMPITPGPNPTTTNVGVGPQATDTTNPGPATTPGPTGTTGTPAPTTTDTSGPVDTGPQGAGGAPPGPEGAGGTPPVPGAGGTAVVPEPVGLPDGFVDPGVFAPDLDGFYWEGTCVGNGGDPRQCALANDFDPNNIGGCKVNLPKEITVHGDAATKYVMEIEVRGLLGSRCYYGGVRRAGDKPADLNGPNDGFYIGGTVPDNWWNSYEIHVMGGPQGEPDTFYLNAYYDNKSPSITFDKTTCTREEILEVNYKFEIAVMGNSTLLFQINDQNCQAIMNCGNYNDVKECPTYRTVDLVGMDPPATFEQPPINAVGGNNYYPQWAYFDVKSVREAE